LGGIVHAHTQSVFSRLPTIFRCGNFERDRRQSHAGGKNGDHKTKIASTYVVEKGKPLASPA
jgi:hypothetical protein